MGVVSCASQDVVCAKGDACESEAEAMRTSLLQKKDTSDLVAQQYVSDMEALKKEFDAQEEKTDKANKDYIAAQRELSKKFEIEGNSTEDGRPATRCHIHCGGGTDCCNSECSGNGCHGNKYHNWPSLYSLCCPHNAKCSISTIFASCLSSIPAGSHEGQR